MSKAHEYCILSFKNDSPIYIQLTYRGTTNHFKVLLDKKNMETLQKELGRSNVVLFKENKRISRNDTIKITDSIYVVPLVFRQSRSLK